MRSRTIAIAMASSVAVLTAALIGASVPDLVTTSASGATRKAVTAPAGAAAKATTRVPAGAASRSPQTLTRPLLATAKPFHPSNLSHLGNARQVVVVTASNWSTTYVTVRTYRKDSDGWHRQFKKMAGRIGSHGFAAFGRRKQNSGETPSGTYALKRAFGAAPDPGTAMRYRQFDSNDWWPYDPRDPRTYNVPQYHGRSAATRWRTSWAEHLSHFPAQYEYAVVLGYNLPSGVYVSKSGRQRFASVTADTAAGGGIFLHVRGTGPTAGCVAVGRKHMREILRWLNPGADPLIVMAPESVIGQA